MPDSIEQVIARIISSILQVDSSEIEENIHFGEYGFESVSLAELAAGLNKEFGTALNASQLYEFNTSASLAGMIRSTAGAGNDVESGIDPGAPAADNERALCAIEVELARIVSVITGVAEEELDVAGHFGEFGFESVSLGEFGARITARYGIKVTPLLLYEKNTIHEIARYLYAQAGGSGMPGSKTVPPPEKTMGEHGDRETAQPRASREEQHLPSYEESAVAVIGLAGVFPQSENVDQLWSHLINGDCLVGPIPEDRTELRRWREQETAAHPLRPVLEAGFIKNAAAFDPLFFNISPREADLMDPQQRLFLQTVWSAIEEAGYAASALAGRNIGVFVGVSSNDFALLTTGTAGAADAFSSTGNAYSILANRVSYFFDFHGPSQPVDTACSSSLVALHYAVESLRAGGCEMAIAGGVNVMLSPAFFQSFINAGMLSPSGRCRTFDAFADGYARGEGVVALVLKPLSKARADGDHIHGVIRGSAVNHGGRAHSLTAPNVIAQAVLVEKAYRQAGIDPSTVDYIEAHGTGTKLGDPIEVNALKKAFDALYRHWGKTEAILPHCGLGSLKTNIGHLEAAAGAAGIVKILLAFKHRRLPKTVNFTAQNPLIDLAGSPFYIVSETREWAEPPDDSRPGRRPKRAGVSSFGFGGANAHVILEEYLEAEKPAHRPSTHQPEVVVFSAKNKERLGKQIANLSQFLKKRRRHPAPLETIGVTSTLPRIFTAVSQLLKIDPRELAENESLTELGLDRYHFSQLTDRLNSEWELDLTIADLIHCHTLRELAASLAERFGAKPRAEVSEINLPLSDDSEPAILLEDLAHTLRTGREAMDERLSFIVSSFDELMLEMDRYLESAPPGSPRFSGNTHESKSRLDRLYNNEEGRAYLIHLSRSGKLETLAQLWAEGAPVDWRFLSQGRQARSVSLPTYPFSEEPYRISACPAAEDEDPAAAVEMAQAEDRFHSAAAATRLHDLSTAISRSVRRSISTVIKLNPENIGSDAEFESIGLNSITLTELAALLNRQFELDILPTVFFDHSTLDRLTAYLAATYRDTLVEYFADDIPREEKRLRPAHPGKVNNPDGRMGRTAAQKQRPTVSPSEPVLNSRSQIAIIGMSGQFPMADDVNQFWKNLVSGKNCITEIPRARWDWREYYGDPARDAGKTNIKWGGFINGIDEFDPFFFGISPREAELMDPQQRLLMIHAWQCIEDAGYAPRSLAGTKTGLFVGTAQCGYTNLITKLNIPVENYTALGTVASVGPNRMSYFLDLRGPSEPVETACSSSLVAIHRAVQLLENGDCDLAIAGGVHTMVTPDFHISISKSGMLAPDGLCKTFSDRADGYVRGEGVGLLLLKPLARAERDGDHIYGLILASAENHGGRANSLTAPSSRAQAELIKEAYRKARVDPAQVTYIEAHGTGTRLGDPIEIEGLKSAFADLAAEAGGGRGKGAHCGLGSVKTNIGHLELAAGIAGVIKVLLQLKHKTLVPSLHCETVNPFIRLDDSPFYLVRENQEWKSTCDAQGNALPRTAGVSSFGFGGVNAHVVIQEYIPAPAPRTESKTVAPQPVVIALSAKNEERLAAQVQRLSRALAEWHENDGSLEDIAYTLAAGRDPMEERLALSVSSLSALRRALAAVANNEEPGCFVFRGRAQKKQDPPQACADDEGDRRNSSPPVAEPSADFLADLYLRRDMENIARLWASGVSIDWEALDRRSRRHRLSLPTYAFAKERYWVSAQATSGTVRGGDSLPQEKAAGQPITAVPAPEENYELLTFEEAWEEQSPTLGPKKENKIVVCCVSQRGFQKAIARAMGAADPRSTVVFLARGASFKKESPRSYTMRGTEAAAFSEAFSAIRDDLGAVESLLYLWPLEDERLIEDHTTIMGLIQALASAKLNVERVLLVGAQRNGLERCYLESWIGFERSLGLILPDVRLAVIALEAELRRGWRAHNEWLSQLIVETQSPAPQSVLYLNGKRHVLRIRPLTPDSNENLTRSGNTYLITGGLGGLGFLVAEHLSQTRGVNLILTGRSASDARMREKINALEAKGSRVFYIKADVSDRDRMKAGLAAAGKLFGRIDGVIHAAGIVDKTEFLAKDPAAFQSVLAPKITGALVLDDLLGGSPVDFTCYFSSSSAILGDFGFCDYAVGNRFLTAFADFRRRRQAPGRTVAICWPLWKDGGMHLDGDENTRMYLQLSGQRLLETAEGLALFDRLTAGSAPHPLAIAGQPSRVLRFLKLGPDTGPATASPSATRPGKGRRPEMLGMTVEECLLADLKDQVSGLLKINSENIGSDANLADFGFDSIGLSSFAGVLSGFYGFPVTPSIFYGHSTLARLAKYFLKEHVETLGAFYSAEAPTPVTPLPLSPGESQPEIPAMPESGSIVKHAAHSLREPLAIIGMSGLFPDADNIDEMWDILEKGLDVVRAIPEDRMPAGRGRKGGFIRDVRRFDPLFFEISPLEAENMDPRQRLLLQEAWRALENAGYGASRIESGRIGMFVGVEQGTYEKLPGSAENLTCNHDGILAARLAYFLNFTGPVMAINTACSSGLVAAHQAALSLSAGECDVALAAGVNLLLTPDVFDAMGEAGMLSPDGRSYTFDQRANGMVPGEAVAVIVLKRLSQALADGDPIDAVIRGHGINYDGKTNGITAPSGVAQTALLSSVYDEYRINPEEIEYVVAHGTGTRLGDPVEVNALNEAFRRFTKKSAYCALTSTKTNFGHTLAASGLVSLISLVQAFKHETIPASLHCEQENEFILWQDTPFYINKAAKPWPAREGKKRMGSVSAFGMSGTNAYFVLESYPEKQTAAPRAHAPCFLLTISAKSGSALAEKAQGMIDAFNRPDVRAGGLPSISYTLLAGRRHWEHRLAIVAADPDEAGRALIHYINGEKSSNLFQGTISSSFSATRALKEETAETTALCRTQKENAAAFRETLLTLAGLYCRGADIPVELLFDAEKPHRLHLPSYPFAREQYWKTDSAPSGSLGGAAGRPLHPLVHENRSDFTEQRYRSVFSGAEFFLKDHMVGGSRVLPAVAYLEMVHAALVNASGGDGAGDSFFQIKNAVWARPLVVEGNAVCLDIVLIPKTGGEVDFSIRGPAATEGEEPILYCRGSASLGRPQEAPRLDCAAIQAECSSHVIDSDRCYEIFSEWGLAYGPAFRAVQKIYVGEHGAFAVLLLPEAAAALGQFVLHPSLLDAAQQSALGLLLKEVSPSPSLPFALEELCLYGACTASMRSYVRRRPGNGTQAGMLKLDLDLCDEEGNVRATLRGLTTRALPRATAVKNSDRASVAPQSGRETGAEIENASYDEAFYKSLVAGIARGEVSKEQMHSILELKAGGDHG